ncbi:hypothetical protein ACH5RR_032578 [Cinchona calisaya]|uniref:Uncharacterized protein n=1 Tax=Cinchona calisaya TaxID=153742 RepID=A0ABD2YJV0_9GENT
MTAFYMRFLQPVPMLNGCKLFIQRARVSSFDELHVGSDYEERGASKLQSQYEAYGRHIHGCPEEMEPRSSAHHLILPGVVCGAQIVNRELPCYAFFWWFEA